MNHITTLVKDSKIKKHIERKIKFLNSLFFNKYIFLKLSFSLKNKQNAVLVIHTNSFYNSNYIF